jgi:uncharacterized membrane protein YdjX (TVP38/TMEM64 family)
MPRATQPIPEELIAQVAREAEALRERLDAFPLQKDPEPIAEKAVEPAVVELELKETKQVEPEEVPQTKFQKCLRNPTTRMILIRVAIRLTTISVVVALIVRFKPPVGKWLQSYLDAITAFGPVQSMVIFWFCSAIFTTFSPTGYLPSVLAGVTFGRIAGPIIAYTSTFTGSCLNLLLVRTVLYRLFSKCSRCTFANARFSWLEKLLKIAPFRVVLLMRLPFLMNGTLNYVFSLSEVNWKPYFLANAIGFIPGCVCYSVLGNQIHSLRSIIDGTGRNMTSIITFSCVCGVSVLCLIILIIVCKRFMRQANANYEAEASEKTIEV